VLSPAFHQPRIATGDPDVMARLDRAGRARCRRSLAIITERSRSDKIFDVIGRRARSQPLQDDTGADLTIETTARSTSRLSTATGEASLARGPARLVSPANAEIVERYLARVVKTTTFWGVRLAHRGQDGCAHRADPQESSAASGR